MSNPLKILTRINFVGPLPPPLHGFSEINQRMLNRLCSKSNVNVFNVSPQCGGLLHLLKLLYKFLCNVSFKRNNSLYLPLSGGLRQSIDYCFSGIALLFGLKIFVHHHSFAYLNRRPLYTICVLFSLRNAKHIVLCNRMRDLLSSQYSIPLENIIVISNAAFLNENTPSNSDSVHSNKLVLGFLSNITNEKGCFEFIELIKVAGKMGLPIEGIMAGPVQDNINIAFNKMIQSTQNIKHVGAVYGEEKNLFFSEIDMLIFPTRYENEAEPVTIWEAMGRAIPVLSLSRGCINGMITNNTGWVIDEPASFIDEAILKIQYLLTNNHVLVSMKESARKEFEKVHMESTINLEALLKEIVGD